MVSRVSIFLLQSGQSFFDFRSLQGVQQMANQAADGIRGFAVQSATANGVDRLGQKLDHVVDGLDVEAGRLGWKDGALRLPPLAAKDTGFFALLLKRRTMGETEVGPLHHAHAARLTRLCC
jgi:hypothetical protein